MAISPDGIRERILSALPGASVAVRDSTGGGDHFAATVIADSFEGMGLVDRHRAIYAALGAAMHSDIHALALETLTPAEAKRKEGNGR